MRRRAAWVSPAWSSARRAWIRSASGCASRVIIRIAYPRARMSKTLQAVGAGHAAPLRGEEGSANGGVEVGVAAGERPAGAGDAGEVRGDKRLDGGQERREADANAAGEDDVVGAIDGVGDSDGASQGTE